MNPITRRKSRGLYLGGVKVGGGAPISIQSMTNTKTADVVGTLAQISRLAAAGCDICRLAVPDMESADVLDAIIKESRLPIVADIHFDYRLALRSIEQGVCGLRLNPGNIGGELRVKQVAAAAKVYGIPIRVGVNGGSLEKDVLAKYGGITPQALTESALRHVMLLEKEGFYDIKISLKSSDINVMLDAYRLIAEECDYPLHIGLTEAGPARRGTVKSAVAMGILLAEGIGDTMRVSLTGDPVEEVFVASEILNALSIRPALFDIISCPSCGRTEIDLEQLVQFVEDGLRGLQADKPLKIAVMGCPVNGPGEARNADFGIAGGKGEGVLFAKGEIIAKYPQEELADKLIEKVKQSLQGQ